MIFILNSKKLIGERIEMLSVEELIAQNMTILIEVKLDNVLVKLNNLKKEICTLTD